MSHAIFMINNDKWVNTIPFKSKELDEVKYQLDESKWVETIPKLKKDNTFKKYSFMSIIFIFGIIMNIYKTKYNIQYQHSHRILFTLYMNKNLVIVK